MAMRSLGALASAIFCLSLSSSSRSLADVSTGFASPKMLDGGFTVVVASSGLVRGFKLSLVRPLGASGAAGGVGRKSVGAFDGGGGRVSLRDST